MLSYHLDSADPTRPYLYAKGFKVADTQDFGRIAKCISRFVWSPIIFGGGERKEANFAAAQLCALDFDNGEMTLEQAVHNVFCDMTHIIATTKSHRLQKGNSPACDRFRVILLFERPITNVRHYRQNMTQALKAHPCDKSCKDGARFFFPSKSIVSVVTDGYELEVIPFDNSPPPDHSARYEMHRRRGTLPSFAQWALTHAWTPGENCNTFCYAIAKDLARCGYTVEQIVHMILRSPTYKDRDISPQLKNEILCAVARGFKAIG